MFKKKECRRCGNKISDKYEFCPHCGFSISGNAKEEDWGMLGKEDNLNEFEDFSRSIFGGIGGKMIGKMIGNAMKSLEKEMQKEIKEKKDIQPRTNFELFINGKRVTPKEMKVTKRPIKEKTIKEEISLNTFSQKSLKKFSNLPKVEPSTNIRRLSNKVIYEIKIPSIKSIKDVSIIRLENSIEIKAVSNNKAYFKLIPISLPITDYKLSKGRLILELDAKD